MITVRDDLLLLTEKGYMRPAYADGLNILCEGGYKKCSSKMVRLTGYTEFNMSNGMRLQLTDKAEVLTPKGYKSVGELTQFTTVSHKWKYDVPKGEFQNLVNVSDFSYENDFILDIGRKEFAILAGIFAASGVRKANGNWLLKLNDNVKDWDGSTSEELLNGLGLSVVNKTRNTFEVKNTPELEVLEGYFGNVSKKGSRYVGEHYIPDEILLNAPNEWLKYFARGVDRSYSSLLHRKLRIPIHNFMSNSNLFVNDYAHLRYFGELTSFQIHNISTTWDSYRPGMYKSPVNDKFNVVINFGTSVSDTNAIGYCVDVGDTSGIYLSGFYIR